MTIREFIEKAYKGGWSHNRIHPSREHISNDEKSRLLLDPKAWEAVGKVEGWFDGEKRWAFFTDEALEMGYKQRDNMRIIGESRDKDEWRITWENINSSYNFPKEYIRIEQNSGWQNHMHSMIDALADGKTLSEYIETL